MPKEKLILIKIVIFKLSLKVKLNYFFSPKSILIKINKIEGQYFRILKTEFAIGNYDFRLPLI